MLLPKLSAHETYQGHEFYKLLKERRDTLTRMVTKEELERTFKLNERTARKLVTYMRKKGFKVCSNSGNKGFFLARKGDITDAEEIAYTYNDLMSRSDDLAETATAFLKDAEDYGIEIKITPEGRRAFVK